jgi:hypothetical protein
LPVHWRGGPEDAVVKLKALDGLAVEEQEGAPVLLADFQGGKALGPWECVPGVLPVGGPQHKDVVPARPEQQVVAAQFV